MLSRVLNILRTHIKRRIFLKKCIVGNNFSCGPNSNCLNGSGKKTSIQISDFVEIMGSLYVSPGGKIQLGHHTTIRFGSMIEAAKEVKIGNYVIISNNVTISDNNNHPTDPNARIRMLESGFYGDLWGWQHARSAPINIGNNVWIGHHAAILKGVSIGEGAVIGCHSVVAHDVPAYTVVAGNPAKIVKSLR